MIPVERIYQATRDGLDIILSLYPQAQECVGQKGKKFKVRDEKTPSACLYKRKTDKYGEIWGRPTSEVSRSPRQSKEFSAANGVLSG